MTTGRTRHTVVAFVRLRWRLLAASLRGQGPEKAGVVLSTAASVVVGGGAGIVLAIAGRSMASAQEPDSDLFVLAAAYGFALATSHGYSDGNKRTAYMVMYSFLLVNGHELEVAQSDVVSLMLDVATRRMSEEELAAWLRGHTVPFNG